LSADGICQPAFVVVKRSGRARMLAFVATLFFAAAALP
jgi:hypothetical protein